MQKHKWQRAFSGMWGGQSWRDVKPVLIGISMLAAFGFTAALYIVDNRLSYYSGLCDEPSSGTYIEDADARRASCE